MGEASGCFLFQQDLVLLYMVKGSRVSLLYWAFFQEERNRSLTVLFKLKIVGK